MTIACHVRACDQVATVRDRDGGTPFCDDHRHVAWDGTVPLSAGVPSRVTSRDTSRVTSRVTRNAGATP